ncbi:hypothetical protein PCASD_12405 [Puccinia coronata f. sp. avenae]|uniref:Uncharacterized protein n=1 Tax=Puccinia coronata f. sp. avenae TaxID=200324 RepID=A0A2N5U4P7_9BASI|nr:hypothetical protein PCASD_12405 [Puccinia coronata f. sp. avenae]
MAASERLATEFELVSDSLGGARPSLNWMAASDKNLDAAIRARFSGSRQLPNSFSTTNLSSSSSSILGSSVSSQNSLALHSLFFISRLHLYQPSSHTYLIHASTSSSLPENLARMAASEFLSDAAIRFKLRRAPPSESLTDSNSVAKRPGR